MDVIDLYVAGTRGFAIEIAQYVVTLIRRGHPWQFVGYVGGDSDEIGQQLPLGNVILSDDEFLEKAPAICAVAIGIGKPEIRKKIRRALFFCSPGDNLPNLLHPTAVYDFDGLYSDSETRSLRTQQSQIALRLVTLTTLITMRQSDTTSQSEAIALLTREQIYRAGLSLEMAS